MAKDEQESKRKKIVDAPPGGEPVELPMQQGQPQAIPQIQFEMAQPGQQIPLVQFLPQSTPQLIAQTQQPVTPQILKNVQDLVDTMTNSTKEGNVSEAQIPSQIILISSAILAVVGVFALGSGSEDVTLGVSKAILFITAVVGLAVSLLTGVLHFLSERKFWYRIREKSQFALNIISAVKTDADRDNAALQASRLMDSGSSRMAIWVQMISFSVAMIALVTLVLMAIVEKI